MAAQRKKKMSESGKASLQKTGKKMARREYNQAMDNRSAKRRAGGDSYMRPTSSAGTTKKRKAAKKRSR